MFIRAIFDNDFGRGEHHHPADQFGFRNIDAIAVFEERSQRRRTAAVVELLIDDVAVADVLHRADRLFQRNAPQRGRVDARLRVALARAQRAAGQRYGEL
jgi:hypothetical protein